MKNFGKGLLIYVIGELVIYGITQAVENLKNGKDVFGNPMNPPKKTEVDAFDPNKIRIGQDDFVVE